jgi:hypothetical protein
MNMPPRGKTTKSKAAWLEVFTFAIEACGVDANQNQIIEWVSQTPNRWNRFADELPAESTCKGYIREILSESDRSWLEAPWSIGSFYSHSGAETLIPYDCLEVVLRLWRRLVIGQKTLTCRRAIWIARLHRLFGVDRYGERFLHHMAAAYSSQERAAELTGAEFDSTALDAELAFLYAHKDPAGAEAYGRMLGLLRSMNDLPQGNNQTLEESDDSLVLSLRAIDDEVMLHTVEITGELLEQITEKSEIRFQDQEAWKTDAFMVAWRAIGGRELSADVSQKKERNRFATRLRQLISDENWDGFDEWTNKIIEGAE